MPLRIRQIDFLRGVAVILVLFSHHWVGIDLLQQVTWISPDLFFVLSGFLVSGLLFSEYKRYGKIKPVQFLIRRGFKIYPLFYVSLLLTLTIFIFIPETFPAQAGLDTPRLIYTIFCEIAFLQNYLYFLWGHHWTLAIEEHFYIAIALILPLLVKLKIFENKKLLLFITLALFASAIVMRFIKTDGFRQTHLRFDSILAGVVIAYFYHFSREKFERFYHKHRKYLLVFIPILLSTVFASWESYFTRTIGFTFIYLGFSILLMEFILNPKTDDNLSRLGFFYTWTARMGIYSYGIYLFHLYLPQFILGKEYLYLVGKNYPFTMKVLISFLIYFFGAIAIGIVMSKLIEFPTLKFRDKFFPSRAKT
jgi:peptidoglycan/LPS O-acetylase OafA/YrhL